MSSDSLHSLAWPSSCARTAASMAQWLGRSYSLVRLRSAIICAQLLFVAAPTLASLMWDG